MKKIDIFRLVVWFFVDIFLLIIWIFVGIGNIIACVNGVEISWVTYWICYAISIFCLIRNIF